jgi:hypothetical protein
MTGVRYFAFQFRSRQPETTVKHYSDNSIWEEYLVLPNALPFGTIVIALSPD